MTMYMSCRRAIEILLRLNQEESLLVVTLRENFNNAASVLSSWLLNVAKKQVEILKQSIAVLYMWALVYYYYRAAWNADSV